MTFRWPWTAANPRVCDSTVVGAPLQIALDPPTMGIEEGGIDAQCARSLLRCGPQRKRTLHPASSGAVQAAPVLWGYYRSVCECLLQTSCNANVRMCE